MGTQSLVTVSVRESRWVYRERYSVTRYKDVAVTLAGVATMRDTVRRGIFVTRVSVFLHRYGGGAL